MHIPVRNKENKCTCPLISFISLTKFFLLGFLASWYIFPGLLQSDGWRRSWIRLGIPRPGLDTPQIEGKILKILIVNCFLDARLAKGFKLEMARNLVLPNEPVKLTFITPGDGRPETVNDFSHLVISGRRPQSVRKVIGMCPWCS